MIIGEIGKSHKTMFKVIWVCEIRDNWPECPGIIIKYFTQKKRAQEYGEREIAAAKDLGLRPMPTYSVYKIKPYP